MTKASAGLLPSSLLRSTAATTVATSGHVAVLDAVRGLAILLVLAYHFGGSARSLGLNNPALAVSQLGWCGVDLFFVLSGFLITGILYDSRKASRYYINFYARRALRIFPLYYGAVLVVLALGRLYPSAEISFNADPLWLVLFLTNIIVATDGTSAAGIMTHYWSLAVEEHFYLIWPLLIHRYTRRQMIGVSVGLLVAVFVLRTTLVLLDVNQVAIYVLTATRMDALVVGSACSLAIRGPGGLPATTRPAVWATLTAGGGFVLVLAIRRTVYAFDPLVQAVGYSLLAITFGGALLLSMRSPLDMLIDLRPLRWLGKYSYSIYVWHPTVNFILLHSAVSPQDMGDGVGGRIALLLTSLTVVILVSLLSFHLWEQPFLGLKRFFVK